MKKEGQDRKGKRIGEIRGKGARRTIYGQSETRYRGKETFDGVTGGRRKLAERGYTVGIFWYVGGFFVNRLQKKRADILSEKTGMVDSDHSHFYVWDEVSDVFPYADFATFPRGRVIYDLGGKRYIIYSDICIPDKEIKRFAKRNKLIPFIINRDEHYRCDKCMKNME